MTQRPSGMPAQAACQTEPSIVAAKASAAPRTRTSPLVPSTSIRTKPARNVPAIAPTIPQA